MIHEREARATVAPRQPVQIPRAEGIRARHLLLAKVIAGKGDRMPMIA